MDKKNYPSKIKYTKKWNKENVNVSLNRDIINKLKDRLSEGQTLKSIIEELIVKNYSI
jgi:hypothetical protein